MENKEPISAEELRRRLSYMADGEIYLIPITDCQKEGDDDEV